MIKSLNKIRQLDSLQLMRYILTRSGSMSHLKLQKLVYYIEGHHLAYFEAPLIEDEFEAWVHGPVSRKIFNALREHSLLYGDIRFVKETGVQAPEEIAHKTLSQDQIDLIDEVIETYGKFTGMQLESMTHNEKPWLEARKGCAPGDKCTNLISKETMRTYFLNQVYGQ